MIVSRHNSRLDVVNLDGDRNAAPLQGVEQRPEAPWRHQQVHRHPRATCVCPFLQVMRLDEGGDQVHLRLRGGPDADQPVPETSADNVSPEDVLSTKSRGNGLNSEDLWILLNFTE